MANEGLRYNQGKVPYHLLSPLALESLAQVLGKGAEKYAERNWERGLRWADCYGSLQRHANKWMLGEQTDPETGLPHMAHVMCNAMFLLHFELTDTGEDNRPKYNNNGDVDAGDSNTVEHSGLSNVQADLFPEIERGCKRAYGGMA